MTIAQPRFPEHHPNHAIECKFQIESGFRELVKQAVDAGWSEDDVAKALIDLARYSLKGTVEDRRTQASIDSDRQP